MVKSGVMVWWLSVVGDLFFGCGGGTRCFWGYVAPSVDGIGVRFFLVSFAGGDWRVADRVSLMI